MKKLIITRKTTNEVVETIEYDHYVSGHQEWNEQQWYRVDYPSTEYIMTWEGSNWS